VSEIEETETSMTVVDHCAARLHRAGWSMGDARLDYGTWFVSGTNGENDIEARAATQGEAWRLGWDKRGQS
jgi:hypothetical protein